MREGTGRGRELFMSNTVRVDGSAKMHIVRDLRDRSTLPASFESHHLLDVEASCQLPFMDNLTSRQRAHLRKLAHHLKPVVLVGGDGVTTAVLNAVEEAFNTRELLKVKLQESAPLHVRDAAGELSTRIIGSHSVQTIGRTVILYRPHPEHPEIRLPRPGD